MKTKETLKQRLLDLLNVPQYKMVRQIPFTQRNYIQSELQMEFDYKMQDIMDEWDKI